MQKLPRSLNKIALLFASVGSIIGSGWLFGPLYAAQIAGPAAIFSWVIGGCLMLSVAFVLGELATMLPVSGSIARYSHFSHGAFVSYIMAWTIWIAYILLIPAEAFAMLQYLSTYVPQLVNVVDGKSALTHLGFLSAIFLLVLMSILNILGIKILSRCNVLLVLIKLIVPVITAVILIYFSFHPKNLIAFGGFAPNGIKSIFDALPLAGVVFSYFGFRAAIDLAGEAENPQKTLPFALLGSLLLCTVIYSFIQFAFITAIPQNYLVNGWKNLHFAGEAGPFAGLAAGLGLIPLVMILYIDAFISPFGLALITLTASARMNYAMSRNGYAPGFFTKLNSKKTPYYAIIFNVFIGLLFMQFFPGWQKLVEFVIAGLVLSHTIAPLSLVALRLQLPERPRPFRLPLSSFFCFVAFFILNLFAYWSGWDTVQKTLIALVIGVVLLALYRLWQSFRGEEKPSLHLESVIWLIPYFLGLAWISHNGNFGNALKKIPLGTDVLFIGILSIFVLWLATKYRLSRSELLKQMAHYKKEIG